MEFQSFPKFAPDLVQNACLPAAVFAANHE
jgi:hypothetical protein